MKIGFVRIMEDEGGIYFRIEAVSRSRFDSLLDLFLATFPVRIWNENRRAWQLPHHYRDMLIKFAIATFGKERVVIEPVSYQIRFTF